MVEPAQQSVPRVKVMGSGWPTRHGRNPYRDLMLDTKFVKREMRRRGRHAAKSLGDTAVVGFYFS